jgi:hypothetical protein
MFLLLSLGRFLCWWTISPPGYHPPVVSVSVLTWFIRYLRFYYYHWVDSSAGGLLVPRGIILLTSVLKCGKITSGLNHKDNIHSIIIVKIGLLVCLKMFNATFNYISVISWRSVFLVEETGPVASHWQTLSHNVVHLTLIEIRTHNISSDRHWLHG